MRPRSALSECFSVMRTKDRRRGKSRNFEFACDESARKATKSFTSSPGALADGWFELHQLKKAVPQKFHNAASRRDATNGGKGAKRGRVPPPRQMSELFCCFSAFPRGGKALLFVRDAFCRTADNDRLPRLRHQSQLIRTRCRDLLLIDTRGAVK